MLLFAAALPGVPLELRSVIACDRDPAPLGLLLVTLKFAATAISQPSINCEAQK